MRVQLIPLREENETSLECIDQNLSFKKPADYLLNSFVGFYLINDLFKNAIQFEVINVNMILIMSMIFLHVGLHNSEV